jgi:hypothetical protein
MALSKITLKKKWLALYLEADCGLLFNQSTRILFSLHSALVAIVLLIDDGLDKTGILVTLQEKTHLPIEDIETYYQSVSEMCSENENETTYADGQYPELKTLNINKILEKTAVGSHPSYQIADTTFSINGETNLTEEIHRLLQPIKKTVTTINFSINIERKLNQYHIYANNLLIEQCQYYEEVIPLVIDRMQILAFQNSQYTFCFHGAALATPKGNLLLPGESGAGKSTLSALLQNNQNQLYSDEIISLDKHFQISVIALPIAIKSGSWQVVGKKHPELLQAKTWHRIDGRQLRYLWPIKFAQHSAQVSSKNLIINPNYSEASSTAKITELNVIDTISLLTKSGYQLGFELNTEKLEHFIQFLQNSTNIKLTYNSSDEVDRVLASIW